MTLDWTRTCGENTAAMASNVLLVLVVSVAGCLAGDINRQSIVFYEETPEVFYCPQEKAISLEGMIVKARPLKNLCEHEGRRLPADYKSDCYNDVDETEYACNEKKRILLKLKPPGSENAIIDNFVPILTKGRYKIGKLPEEREAEERERREKEQKKEEKSRNPKKDF